MFARATSLALFALAACSAPAPRESNEAVAEAPFAETSAQDAANVVQTYYALLEQGRHGDARRLWAGDGQASGLDEAAFTASFAAFAQYHAEVGAPGRVEGAAGSLFVEVPVVLYGRLKSGKSFSREAVATLRRVNGVPGSSAEDRRWHIHTIEAKTSA